MPGRTIIAMPDNPPTSPSLLCINVGRTLYSVVTDTKNAGIAASDYRALFITEHAHNIALLLGNIGSMGSKFQAYATRLLVRPMYEGMFHMIAAIRDPDFAKSKMLHEVNHWLKISKSYKATLAAKSEDTTVIDARIMELENESTRWQATNNVQVREPRDFSPWKICEVADCKGWYIQYQQLCDYTHSAFSSLNALAETNKGTILHQSTVVGGNTLLEYRKFLDPAREQEHLNEADENVALIMQMIRDGTYDRETWE